MKSPLHEARSILRALEIAGVFKAGETVSIEPSLPEQCLYIGPYRIPSAYCKSEAAIVDYVLKAKAQADIAQQIADGKYVAIANEMMADCDDHYYEERVLGKPTIDGLAALVGNPAPQPAVDALYGELQADLELRVDTYVNRLKDPLDSTGATENPEAYGAVDYDDWGKPRIGDWIQTFTGVKFHPLDIHPDDIKIEDIAHHLALINRFTGATRVPYSVAEHCIRASRLVGVHFGRTMSEKGLSYDLAAYKRQWNLQLEALLHDASEAYLNDMSRPVKHLEDMAGYRTIEKKVEQAIASKFGVPFPMSPEVKRADIVLLVTEARDLMGPKPTEWRITEPPLDQKIVPMGWEKAEQRFLDIFENLQSSLANA